MFHCKLFYSLIFLPAICVLISSYFNYFSTNYFITQVFIIIYWRIVVCNNYLLANYVKYYLNYLLIISITNYYYYLW